MTIHNFDNVENPRKMVDQQFAPRSPNLDEQPRPNQTTLPVAIDAKPSDDILFERMNINVAEEVREILPQGYRTMDRGIKNYFSGIQVPTKDGSRIMQVRITGGDKPYLIWAQDLKRGRVYLPVMAIKRSDDAHYESKFSPAYYHYMSKRYLDPSGTRIALAYRPVPSLINYTLSIWAEHKRDLEYIFYQIRTRFNPCAEFFAEDEHLRGSVFMKYNGMTVASDDEVPADQRQNKRYDITIVMEGWIPLPEKIVPSIVGRVASFKEGIAKIPKGEVLDVILGKQILNTAQIK